ncbi:MAG: YfjI family protein, partial [Chloroflexota bacterium]|nr:YfjI family protein [Chloroflexota bacterium]
VSDWLDAGGDAAELRRLIAEAPRWEAGESPNSSNPSPNNPPAFPVEVLPPAVRAYALAAARSIPVPVEMVAVPMLGFAGALLGNRLHLELKPSYREYPSLYLALVLPPGTAKSPALKLAHWPLDVLQREAVKRHREQVAAYEADLDAWKKRDDAGRGDKPTKPVLRHYFSTNLTIEALVGMLERSPGVAIVRDEILSWVRSMDQYRGGKGSDRQEFLSLWSSSTIKADRKGGEPVYRPFPVACVVGGIQPDFVAELHDDANRRDGFVERLLPVVLDLGAARWTEETVDPARFGDVLGVFEALDRLPPADLDGDPAASVGIGVRLHPEARALWTEWFDENAGLVERASGLATGFSRKLPAHVARLALILHALWNPSDPRPMVSAERMADAIELGEFFRAHVGRLLPLLGSAGDSRSAGLSTRILRILRNPEASEEAGGAAWVTRSTILNQLRNVKAEELSCALFALRDAGRVESATRPTSTKPVELWRLSRREDSDISEISPSGGGAGEGTGVEPTKDGESPNTPKIPEGVSEAGWPAPDVGRPAADPVSDACCLCGAPLPPGRSYLCAGCGQAAA